MKYDLVFKFPWMNAAGASGFAPDLAGLVDWSKVGAFITHPLSLEPRSPAQGSRCLEFPGGFLLHTGYPNPGLKAALHHYGERWRRCPAPVVVHLLAQTPVEVAAMLSVLEGVESVAGIELGLPPVVEVGLATALVQAATGELPVIVRLPLERAHELAPRLAGLEPVMAFSLGPPRGALVDAQGALVHGRLYGPAVFPLALEAVRLLKQQGIATIGAGGLYQPAHGRAMLQAGALAVQLDAVLWLGKLEQGWHDLGAALSAP